MTKLVDTIKGLLVLENESVIQTIKQGAGPGFEWRGSLTYKHLDQYGGFRRAKLIWSFNQSCESHLQLSSDRDIRV